MTTPHSADPARPERVDETAALSVERRTGKALGSNAVIADSTQTLLCTYLSVVLLIGLLSSVTLGWGWADPIAGLVVAAVAAREGVHAWRGEGCCAPINTASPQVGDDCSCDSGGADRCCDGGRRPTYHEFDGN